MADDTQAALIAQLDVKFDQLASNMRKAMTVFDDGGRKLEKRQAELRKRLSNWAIKLPGAIVGAGALYGVERFVSSIVDAGGKIKDTADAIGVGTDELQAWGLLADRAGTSQEDFNSALQKFAKNLGDAAIQGGDAAKVYRALGVDLHAGPTAAFYELADAVAKAKGPQQQVAIVTSALGKSAAKLTPILAQGSAALKSQTAELVKSGQVIKASALDKLDDLGDAWSDLKRQFQAAGGNALEEPISKLAGALKDPEVLAGIRTFGNLLADVAIAAAKVAKYAPVVASMWAGAKFGRLAGVEGILPGAALGGLAYVGGKAFIGNDNASATPQVKAAKTAHGDGTDYSDILGNDAKKIADGDRELAEAAQDDARKTRDVILDANQQIRDSNLEVSDARRDSVRAQDDALLQLSQGTDTYYQLQKAVIAEIAKLDIGSITDRKDADLAALKERADEAGKLADEELASRKRQLSKQVQGEEISPAQAAKSLDDFRAELDAQRQSRDAETAARAVALEQSAANQIKAINTKKNADLQQADEDYLGTKAKLIAVNDSIREGLMNIGTAGLHGFGSLKDAAASALDQIAEMIVQMYILEPLIRNLFGKSGTTGGGIIGSFISSIFPFAEGGVMTPQGPRLLPRYATGGVARSMAIFGEAGPEAAVPLPDGRRIPVDLRAPAAPQIPMRPGGAPTIIQHFDLSGAVVTDEIMARAARAGDASAAARIAQYDKALPTKVAHLRQNPRVR